MPFGNVLTRLYDAFSSVLISIMAQLCDIFSFVLVHIFIGKKETNTKKNIPHKKNKKKTTRIYFIQKLKTIK